MKKTVFIVGIDPSVKEMFLSQGWAVTTSPLEADFLCFTGGADVSPHLYGEVNRGKSFCDERRDIREVSIYKAFVGDRGMLGICRGGQFLNVMAGGKLRQHIEGHHGYNLVTHIKDGKVVIHEDHHQEIIPTPVGDEFLVAKDGVVEGVYYNSTKALCFQPHPEWGHHITKELFFKEISTRYELT